MGIEILLRKINDYTPSDKLLIIRAFAFANKVHKGVLRKSGEPYIIHPLNVGCILAEMHADAQTIAAGIMHDCIEDGAGITKELIAEQFGDKIAELVDGVTKWKKVDFNNDKKMTDSANMKKIVESILVDIRIFIIKLADRLHNMRTLEFQSLQKQIENAEETLRLFVPIAHLIGQYTIKSELEDLSFKYLKPEEYKKIDELKKEVAREYRQVLDEIICMVAQMLNIEKIEYDIEVKIKNHYALYNRLQHYKDPAKVHDLIAIKLLVDDIETCYKVRDQIEKLFEPVPERAKDYIKQPKTNMYSSLHTTIKTSNNRLIQFQIKTKEMYRINAYGLTAYWQLQERNREFNPASKMQEDLRKLQFFQTLDDIYHANAGNTENFNFEVNQMILSKKIYVRTPNEEIIELPVGATPVDFAYKIHTDLGNYLIAAQVNGEYVPLDTPLKNRDIITIIADENLVGPRRDYSNMCRTNRSLRKIKEFRKSHYMR